MKKILICVMAFCFLGGQAIFGKNKTEVIPLYKRGALNLLMPENYEMNVYSEQNSISPTIEIYTKEKALIMITPLWDENSKEKISDKDLKDIIESGKNYMLPYAVETKVDIKKIDGKDSKGYYFILTDKAPKPNEYKYCLRSVLSVGDLLINATIFSNDNSAEIINRTIELLSNLSQTKQSEQIEKIANETFEKNNLNDLQKYSDSIKKGYESVKK